MQTSVHVAPVDPGTRWVKDPGVRVDIPDAPGHWRALTPDVIAIPGGFRMYYTRVGPGSNYDVTPGWILSAVSADGEHWETEPGVRLEPFGPHADLRVVCPDVVPAADGSWRMYIEGQPRNGPACIVSARSDDGLAWTPEPGVRYGDGINRLGSPRVLETGAGPGAPDRFRLYFHRYPLPLRRALDAGNHILSAVSSDGLTFDPEPGVRIAQESALEDYVVYAAEVLRLGTGGWRMYYAGWTADPVRGRILGARSDDGVTWVKDAEPLVEPGGPGTFDAERCSEPSVIQLPDGRYRMFYEACDEREVWRIMSATSAA